ncbi:hypothetical protein QTG56_23150 (plasmid) [Rossellomorea sp. AcN35-11]|nr:hypothetical protein [Rossellomorea aquimaris]WJV32264.1 hypothetical protein QTG56_23150 [Rossellomorea sp. AcN35-11]
MPKMKKEKIGGKVLAGLTESDHDKLKKLAVSCDMSKTRLSEEIISMALNSANQVMWFQDKYNKDPQYRVAFRQTSKGLEFL